MPDAKEHHAHWLAGIAGLLVALTVAGLEGTPAPWSVFSYYWLGWPLMCVLVYLIARVFPRRPWRWTMSMAVGQVFAVILLGNGNLAPVAMIYTVVLSVPQFAAGAAGARASPRKADVQDTVTANDNDADGEEENG